MYSQCTRRKIKNHVVYQRSIFYGSILTTEFNGTFEISKNKNFAAHTLYIVPAHRCTIPIKKLLSKIVGQDEEFFDEVKHFQVHYQMQNSGEIIAKTSFRYSA